MRIWSEVYHYTVGGEHGNVNWIRRMFGYPIAELLGGEPVVC